MPRLPALLVTLLGITEMFGCHATPAATAPTSAHRCTVSHGLANVVLSYDDGRTLVHSDAPFDEHHDSTVRGLVALDTPGSLLAIVNDTLASEDGGCNWLAHGKTSATKLVEGGGGFAYGWKDNDAGLWVMTTRSVAPLPAPPDHVAALAAEPGEPRHLRLMGISGSIFESIDRGETWTRVGDVGEVVSRAGVDPRDWKHVVVVGEHGLSVSRDGGHSWTRSADPARVSDVMFAKGGVVWAFAEERVYRSTNGGTTFVPGASLVPPYIGPHLIIRRQLDATRTLIISRHSLLRYDAPSAAWTALRTVCQPAFTGRIVPDPGAATLVPSQPGTLCIAFSSYDQSGDPGVFDTSEGCRTNRGAAKAIPTTVRPVETAEHASTPRDLANSNLPSIEP